MAQVEENEVLDGEALSNLYTWIDAVPLSRPKRNIARDFSDGVLVAELIHHYVPRAVDMHNYVQASSTGQKRINWNTLNRKVFSKLNIKLNEVMLKHVVDAKPGAIEQVLWDLRCKIMDHSMKPDFTSESELVGGKYLEVAQSRKNFLSSSSGIKIPSNARSQVGLKQIPSKGSNLTPKKSATEKLKILQSQMNPKKISTITVPEPAAQETSLERDSETNLEENAIPSQIIYKGHKMVSVELLELKDQETKKLENEIRQKVIKIERLDKLIKIKDDRIADLSHELQNIRSMFEQVTQRSLRVDMNGNYQNAVPEHDKL